MALSTAPAILAAKYGDPLGSAGPELRLIFVCLGLAERADTTGAAAELRDAISAVRDWDCFAELVNRHHVSGEMHAVFQRAAIPLPEDRLGWLLNKVHENVRRALVAGAALGRINTAFGVAGLKFAILKGLPLSQALYGDLGIRKSVDIDLIVSPQDVQRALEVLASLGFVPAGKFSAAAAKFGGSWLVANEELALILPEVKLCLDLHWRLFRNRRFCGLSFNPGRLEVAKLGPLALPVLNSEDEFVYLCAHGANHGWTRLKWLVDVRTLLGKISEAEFEALYRRSCAVDAENPVLQAVVLCALLFQLPVPDAAAKVTRDDCVLEFSTRLTLTDLLRDGPAERMHSIPAAIRGTLARLLIKPSLAYMAGELSDIASDPHDLLNMGLPPVLAVVAWVLRVPLWLWLRLGRGRGLGHRKG